VDCTLGTISIRHSDASYNRPARYHCLIGDGHHPGTGLGAWTDDKHFKDPVEAVKNAMRNAERYSDKLKAITDLNRKLTTNFKKKATPKNR